MWLIDADALEKQGWTMHRTIAVDPRTMEMQMKKPTDFPTIDAVPVVRCKDCKNRDTFSCGMQVYGYDDDMNLQKSDDWTMDDGYCYWGERKDV